MKSTLLSLFAVASLLASTYSAAVQPAGDIYRVGFLTWGKAQDFQQRLAAFRQGMADLGYVAGKDFDMVEKYGEGWQERISMLASELVRYSPDVIVTHGGRVAVAVDRAAKQAGRSIPLVFAVDADPVGRGVIVSLARPGGNITGLSDLHSDLVPKRLALLKETLPTLTRVAVLYNGDRQKNQLAAIQAVAPELGLSITPVNLAEPDDLPRVFDTLRKDRPGALNVLGSSLNTGLRTRIAAFALATGLPTIGTGLQNAEAGYLLSYGTNLSDLYRRAATYVDKIFKGAEPADLPVEQATRFYLAVNLKTASALGVVIPQSILLRADKIIE